MASHHDSEICLRTLTIPDITDQYTCKKHFDNDQYTLVTYRCRQPVESNDLPVA